MSSSRKKRNSTPKIQEDIPKSRDGKYSDFLRKGGSVAVNNEISSSNKQREWRNVAQYRFSQTRESSNEKRSVMFNGKPTSVQNSSTLDCSSVRKKEEPNNKPSDTNEVIRKTKKRTKNKSRKMLTTQRAVPSQISESTYHIRKAESTNDPDLSSKSSSEIFLKHRMEKKYNPFGSNRCTSTSEIMRALGKINPVVHFSGSGSTSANVITKINPSQVKEEVSFSPRHRPKKNFMNRKKSGAVNVPPKTCSQNLSQAELINRYNRAHSSKVRDLKGEVPKDILCPELRVQHRETHLNQGHMYVKDTKQYPSSYFVKQSQSTMGTRAVEVNSETLCRMPASRSLSASSLVPPPIIYFKTLNPSQVSNTGFRMADISSVSIGSDNQDDVLMEWEDIEDEKVLLNIKVHRQNVEDLEKYLDLPCEDMETNDFHISENDIKDCLIVLDTNILISHLKFVEELSKQEYKGIGCPVLVIPWMVLKELDVFKDRLHGSKLRDPKVQAKARLAAHFINSCFSAHHPRVKGQSALDDKEHRIVIDVPDDSILNCCLQLQKKGKRVILLSNDVNFCNKAMATGITSYGKEQMNQALILGILEFTAEAKQSLQGTTASKTESVKQFSQTIKKFEALLQEFLSKFIEAEMKRVFKGVWLKVIFLKPPWSLMDALRCLSKHWVAVFGYVMSKSGHQMIKDLIQTFKTEDLCTVTNPREAEKTVQLTIELCGSIISDSYQDLATEYKNYFMSLLKVLKESSAGGSTQVLRDQTTCSSSQSTSHTTVDNSGKDTVFEALQYVWNLVNNFCGVICDTYGIAHEIYYQRPESLPSKEEVKGRLPEASHYVTSIVNCLSSILETPESFLSAEHPSLLSLFAVIQSMVPPDLLVSKSITHEKLLMFCIDNSTRVVLMNGLRQFQEAQALLLKVINCTE